MEEKDFIKLQLDLSEMKADIKMLCLSITEIKEQGMIRCSKHDDRITTIEKDLNRVRRWMFTIVTGVSIAGIIWLAGIVKQGVIHLG